MNKTFTWKFRETLPENYFAWEGKNKCSGET